MMPLSLLILLLVPLAFTQAGQNGDVSLTGATQVSQEDSTTEATRPATRRRVVAKKKGEISFDDLLFTIAKEAQFAVEMIPADVSRYNNTIVTIRGYILPASVLRDKGNKQFVLVRDNQECCFGPKAAIYDCIMIKMVDGKTADFSTRPIAVTGKFRVTTEYQLEDGQYIAIYEILANKVK